MNTFNTTDPQHDFSDLLEAAAWDIPPSTRDEAGHQRTEDAPLSEEVARTALRGKYCHNRAFGWLKFDGKRWERVDDDTALEVVRQALADIYRREHDREICRGEEMNHGRVKHLTVLLSANKIRAVLSLARAQVTVRAEDFDRHPHLLNVANGVLNLRSGELGAHDPNLFLTKVCPVDYRPAASHPDWDKALEAVRPDAAEWLRVRFGQGITGYPPDDDLMVLLKGSGSNGKTTLLDGIASALGPDYAVTAPKQVLLARDGEHPTEMMTLRGARLVVMEELPELGHLNVKRLKDLHGTRTIQSRYCHKDTVEWTASHTMFVTTNYLPRVDESDHGTWRRLALVEFPYRYRPSGEAMGPLDRAGDPNLRSRLRKGTAHEAILAWLVDGARQWYENTQVLPQPPATVVEATQEWRKNADVLLRYMDERLTFDPQSHVAATELFADFSQYLEDSGHRTWATTTFKTRFKNHPEVEAHGVEDNRVRRNAEGLSTSGLNKLPDRFAAWLGVRFQH